MNMNMIIEGHIDLYLIKFCRLEWFQMVRLLPKENVAKCCDIYFLVIACYELTDFVYFLLLFNKFILFLLFLIFYSSLVQ